MAFLDENYLLTNNTAKSIYRQIADLPIIDAHNHADVKAIYENRNFTDIWQAEAASDHYVWEVLRKRGVPEEYITGHADNQEKWFALSDVFEDIAGNHSFEWIHLDLKRQLGIDELICPSNAQSIWDKSREVLQQDAFRPQNLLQKMGVERMCSTDDPVDSLEYHKKLEATSLAGVIRPTFRPDNAMNVFKPSWREYIGTLEERVGSKFTTIDDVIDALQTCHDYFAEHGCVASDHGVEVPYAYNAAREDADAAFRKAYSGKSLTHKEMVVYMSYIMQAVGEMDSTKDWVFQLHMGAVRDQRDKLYNEIGADSGGDISNHTTEIVAPLKDFLNRFDDRLKIVMYTLDPNQHSTVATLCRAFGEKVNVGAAWWMNDSPFGMKQQLEYIASVEVLMNYGGMVSDSRKLLSYGSRTEMFRRVLADVLGGMVEKGQMPPRIADRIAYELAYNRPKTFFGLA